MMVVGTSDGLPECQLLEFPGDRIEVRTELPNGRAKVKIDLSLDGVAERPILEVRCEPTEGKPETLVVE